MPATSDYNSIPVRPGNPIQLLRKKKDGAGNEILEIIPEALRILENIQGPIAVISVVGTMRQGKSYLLSRILGRQKAFELGPTTNPQTFGIWTWDTPYTVSIEGKQATLILLDTEGLEAPCATEDWDTKIFLISLLLSSLFVYNTRGVIDRSAIQKLRIMLDLNELIQSGSDTSKISNSQNNSATLFEYLPQFLWVIRDFTLKFPEGITTARDYMLQALTTELDSSTPKKVSLRMRKELAEVDEIRRTIVSSFNNIDCHTMPLPISNPEAVGFPDVPSAMQALDTIPYEKLSKNFLQTMEEFNSKAFSMLSLKRLKDGTLMNGTSFSHLVKIYANQINSSGIVRISEAYQYMVKEVAQKTMEQAITKYRKYMQYLLRHPDNKSASDSFLNHCNLVSFNKSIEILRRDLLGTTNQIENAIKNFKKNIIHLNHEQQLDKNCVFAEFSLQNSQLIAKENEELIKTLWRDTVELRLTGEGAEFASQYDYSEATQKFARDYFMSCIPGKQANELYIQYCDKIQQNGQRMQWIFRQKEMLANQVLQSEAETNRIKQSSAEAIQEAERLFNDIEGIQNKHHKFQNELEEKLRLKERELSRLRDRLWH